MTAGVGPVPDATKRLAFRAWEREDAGFVLDMYARPEVYAFLGSSPAPVADLAEARDRIARWQSRADGLAGIWAVSTLPGPAPGAGRLVGTALLLTLPRTDGGPSSAFEIGWHLHPDAWGAGHATEAAGALVRRARSGGLAEVRAVVYPGNARSRAVCARLGMREDGLTTEWYGVEVVEYVLDLRHEVAAGT